jgi:hypothetical protein
LQRKKKNAVAAMQCTDNDEINAPTERREKSGLGGPNENYPNWLRTRKGEFKVLS